MSVPTVDAAVVLGPRSAGILMTPEEFDAVTEYDENFHYELVHGVLVVNPVPLPEETGPNELLGRLLGNYQEDHPRGAALDLTLPQQYVRTSTGRRLADRLIWAGFGRVASVRRDPPTIAIEFVSEGKRNRDRDYVDKRHEYLQVGIREFWIIDGLRRTMTVVRAAEGGPQEQVIAEQNTYESPLLPGFVVPLARLLEAADRLAAAD